MLRNGKIKPLDELAEVLELFRSDGKTIVHCHGVFDLLHIGHIRYLEQARDMGNVLVVTLTPDEFVDKGPHRPVFNESLRAEALASLNCVDYVAVNKWPTAEETLRLLKPDIYVKGAEFKNLNSDITGKIGREAEVVREVGARLAFTEDIVFSSTNLINQRLSNFPEEINKYLDLFRQRYTLEELLAALDRLSELKVLVIGDTILDDYQYVEAIGKSSKDPVITVKYQSHDLFAGGALAVANHVANFAGTVELTTVLGKLDSREEFIRSQLQPNITPHFLYQPDSPTLIKRRFVESYSLNKLFEVYVMDDSGLSMNGNSEVCDWLEAELPQYDLVIAADFGHGAISEGIVKTLVEKSRFLAVNTQANSGNRGFHTITRYPRADFACVAEHEIRLEMRRRTGRIHPMMEIIARKLGCSQFVVTQGRAGCVVRDARGGVIEVPAFAQKVVDRVGAGDSFFAITSLAAAQGMSNEKLGFIGNVVGALAVEILGNKKSIDKLSVKKFITSLIK